ncbi:MAG: PAS domain S-box protein [Verrucomicrobiae bacterium]|nr:PAS domain S-box protein [Verrucomicrobiae bacterium]
MFNVDHRIVWPDGSTRWVSVNSRTHFASIDGQRHAQRTIGAARDITETKIFEAGLELRVAERTAELLAVLDAVPDAIVTIDTAFHLLRANAALPKLFGHDRSNISSLTLNTLFATAQDEAAVMEAWTVGDGQGSKSMTTVNCRRTDGSTFPAMVHGRPVRTREGHVVSHVVLIRDLSDELSRREKAVRSQRLEALGQLTGGIAHDSNNLLTVIAGNLELIEDDLGDHPALKYVREAQEASKIGARLNQRLLMFARRRKLEAQTVNLNDQVLAMSELLRRTIGEAIKLTTVLAHDLGATRVDPGEVENAF